MLSNKTPNPLQLYHLEQYLFKTVGPHFQRVGYLSAFEFFCIVIWKANRAKSQIAHRLLTQDREKRKCLDSIVHDLTNALYTAANSKTRLRILCETWGFRLPMASAILTVLYPEEFTVYDVRVCRQLGAHNGLEGKIRFDSLWNAYQDFVKAVRNAVADDISLRDKDRFLWGQSFYGDVMSGVTNCFSKKV